MYSINEIKIKSTMTNLKFHKSCDHDLFTWSLFKKFRLNGLNSDQIQTTFGQMVWIQTSSEKSDQSSNSGYAGAAYLNWLSCSISYDRKQNQKKLK